MTATEQGWRELLNRGGESYQRRWQELLNRGGESYQRRWRELLNGGGGWRCKGPKLSGAGGNNNKK
ncbi:MAG: hypothetical protein SNG81_03110 [Rikenellaceae bacterium]